MSNSPQTRSFADPTAKVPANEAWSPKTETPVGSLYARCPRCGETNIDVDGGFERISNAMVGKSPPESDYPVSTWRLRCLNCHLAEWVSDLHGDDVVEEFHFRWWDHRSHRSFQNYGRRNPWHEVILEKIYRRATWPEDPETLCTEEEMDRFVERRLEDEPDNASLRAQISNSPDDDLLRVAYSAWLDKAPHVPDFRPEFDPHKQKAQLIRDQIAFSRACAADPTHDAVADSQRDLRDRFRSPERIDWLYIRQMPCESPKWVRGFLGHVTMKAKWFLHYHDILFRRAPIQHLTLTYIREHVRELAALPDMARLHSLALPEYYSMNRHMQLNQLRDEDIYVLASSPHLGNLSYLDLDDGPKITDRTFAALALSPYLTSLSYIRDWAYPSRGSAAWGGSVELPPRGQGHDITKALGPGWERHLGYLPFIHPEEHYGLAEPTIDRVEAHPVGRASFRPDIAARARPRLPPALAHGILDRIDVAGSTIRDANLAVPLPGGRFIATLESVERYPQSFYADVMTYVTLTVQSTPENVAVYDVLTDRNVTLAARVTVKLLVPTFLVKL